MNKQVLHTFLKRFSSFKCRSRSPLINDLEWVLQMCGRRVNTQQQVFKFFLPQNRSNQFDSWNPFLESRENFSGPKSHSYNCGSLILLSWSFDLL